MCEVRGARREVRGARCGFEAGYGHVTLSISAIATTVMKTLITPSVVVAIAGSDRPAWRKTAVEYCA